MNPRKKSRASSDVHFPEEVVMEILSRMPANDVLKCRRVCRQWRDLISTQIFQEMHLKAKARHSPMILLEKDFTDELVLLDKWEPPRKKLTIGSIIRSSIDNLEPRCWSNIELSYDGLIVMRSIPISMNFQVLSIFNPISEDVVRIESSNSPGIGVRGMFFNPLTKEYSILLQKNFLGAGFQILNLGAQPCYRALKQPPPPFLKEIEIRYSGPPVVIDDATIYWLSGKIIAFDVKTEEFSLMPCPECPMDNCDNSRHSNMQLLQMDGCLAFLLITITTMSVIIHIWTLKDSATTLWIKSNNVIISFDQLNIDNGTLGTTKFEVMAVVNGELLMQCSFPKRGRRERFTRFCSCNIEGGIAVPNFQYDGNLCPWQKQIDQEGSYRRLATFDKFVSFS